MLIFRFVSLRSLRWHLSHSASIDNRLNLLYIHILFIHTTALLMDLQSLHMSALCHVTPYLYYSALLYWSVSFSLLSSCAQFYSVPSDFKTCLLELLYYKDCITTRQSWLFSFYVVINNKEDKMKLENITIIFYSITYYCPFFRYTTSLFILKYFL